MNWVSVRSLFSLFCFEFVGFDDLESNEKHKQIKFHLSFSLSVIKIAPSNEYNIKKFKYIMFSIEFDIITECSSGDFGLNQIHYRAQWTAQDGVS